MSEFKGTSGQWCVNDNNDVCVGYKEIAFLRSSTKNQERRANALLISKAPQMLEMLKVIIELSEDNLKNNTDFTLSEYYTEYEEAKQLIKEATELNRRNENKF